MRRVIIESPYAGTGWLAWWRRALNRRYAQRCLLDCLTRGEAPIASHLLYTQVLRDSDPVERARGIEAGLAWGAVADATVVYTDRGISRGMRLGIQAAERDGRPVELRHLDGR